MRREGRDHGEGGDKGGSHPYARGGTSAGTWERDLESRDGPDLKEILLTQNLISGAGPRVGRNTRDPAVVCVMKGCESTRNLRHLEWGGIPAQRKDDKIIVARILAAMRDLRWCDTHWEGAMVSARALVGTVLNPRVRDGMAQVGKAGREALDSVRVITHEGKYVRDLLEQMMDMRGDVYPAVKHLRGLCSNILKVGGDGSRGQRLRAPHLRPHHQVIWDRGWQSILTFHPHCATRVSRITSSGHRGR